MNPEPVTNGLTDFLSLPARDERGEGVPGTVGPIYPLPKRPSSPRPSPPSEGGEGEERNLSRCQEAHYPPRKDQSLLTSAPTDHGASAHQDSLGAALESQATRSADAHVRELDTQRERADVGVRAPPGATEARGLDDEFQRLLDGTEPILALAPMQDVTDQPFWRLMASYGGAESFSPENFCAPALSTLVKYISKTTTAIQTTGPPM